ncbi:major facilitator superfamily domain-containing protein [Dipodascopsis uninucleata]
MASKVANEEAVPLLNDDGNSSLGPDSELGSTSGHSITEDELIEEEIEEELATRDLVVIWISLYVGIFLSALDGTIVATLMAHIASEFNEFRSISWIATGYMISTAAFQPLYGKISDIFGRKPILLLCNTLFGIGTILCGLSPNLWFMVGARILAGCGGGGLTSLTAITLSDIVPLRQRGVLQGIGNILYGCGAAFGGVVGVPIIMLSIVCISFNLKVPTKHVDSMSSKLQRIDFMGSFTLVLSLTFFLIAVSIGGSYAPWFSAKVIVSLLLSIAFLNAFIYVENNIAREPIIPLHLFKDRTVFGSSFASWFMNMIYYSHIYYISIYLISVRNVSPTKSGSSLIPHFIGDALGSLVAGYYMRMTGRYFAMIVLAGVAMILGSSMLVFVGLNTSRAAVLAIMFVPGFGFGLYLTLTLVGLVAAVPHEYQAVSTSIQYCFKATGSTLGVSISTSIYQNVLAARLYELITGPGSEELIDKIKDSIEVVKSLTPELKALVISAYLDSIRAVFIYATALSVLCAASAFLMKEHVLHKNVRR